MLLGTYRCIPQRCERRMHDGFSFLPCSEVQRRTAAVLLAGMDAAVQSETGSGVWGAGPSVHTFRSVWVPAPRFSPSQVYHMFV